MKYINLRELYPDVYKTDVLVEVTEEVFAVIRASDRAEDAYKRRMYRYKAQYSLDCNNGIEKVVMVQPPTPEEIMEDKQLREQLYAAVMALPDKQAKRIYAHFYLGMTPKAVSYTHLQIRPLFLKWQRLIWRIFTVHMQFWWTWIPVLF